MNTSPLPSGKLPLDLLKAFLGRLPEGRDVVVGATVGEDAAVVDVGDRYLVLALDPVTLSAQPGRYAVTVNANDIAVMGAEPRWMLAAVLLPPGSTRADAQTVLADLESACAGLGVFLIGGHTEVTPAVTQPVVAACMVGDVEHDRLVRSGGAQAGDSLLLAGSVALEGTAILAREYVDILRGRGVNEGTIAEAAGLLDHPGISVLPAVRALTGTVLPHAMHDPTEGGVLGAAREMALASGLGLRIDAQSVPVLVSCEEICAALGLDPLRLLASGSLLAAVDPRDESAALRALHDAGIEAAAIGTMPSTVDTILLQDGREGALPETDRDELARWIESRANR